MFEIVRDYYKAGLYTEPDVFFFYTAGLITWDEYNEILKGNEGD